MEGLGDLFFKVHSDLPREGPGSDTSTLRALEIARPHLPTSPVIVDMACGPGAQTCALAGALEDARIMAIDLHEPFLGQLRDRLASITTNSEVEIIHGDMTTWAPDDPVDMVWCEGAAYIMGVGEALRRWHAWLPTGGIVALSEAVWLTDNPHPEAASMWEEYPAMGDIEACEALFRSHGFEPIDHFVLPISDWLDAYYAPMEKRLDALREQHAGDKNALAELAIHQREIDVCREHGEDYSYAFIIARKV